MRKALPFSPDRSLPNPRVSFQNPEHRNKEMVAPSKALPFGSPDRSLPTVRAKQPTGPLAMIQPSGHLHHVHADRTDRRHDHNHGALEAKGGYGSSDEGEADSDCESLASVDRTMAVAPFDGEAPGAAFAAGGDSDDEGSVASVDRTMAVVDDDASSRACFHQPTAPPRRAPAAPAGGRPNTGRPGGRPGGRPRPGGRQYQPASSSGDENGGASQGVYVGKFAMARRPTAPPARERDSSVEPDSDGDAGQAGAGGNGRGGNGRGGGRGRPRGRGGLQDITNAQPSMAESKEADDCGQWARWSEEALGRRAAALRVLWRARCPRTQSSQPIPTLPYPTVPLTTTLLPPTPRSRLPPPQLDARGPRPRRHRCRQGRGWAWPR